MSNKSSQSVVSRNTFPIYKIAVDQCNKDINDQIESHKTNSNELFASFGSKSTARTNPVWISKMTDLEIDHERKLRVLNDCKDDAWVRALVQNSTTFLYKIDNCELGSAYYEPDIILSFCEFKNGLLFAKPLISLTKICFSPKTYYPPTINGEFLVFDNYVVSTELSLNLYGSYEIEILTFVPDCFVRHIDQSSQIFRFFCTKKDTDFYTLANGCNRQFKHLVQNDMAMFGSKMCKNGKKCTNFDIKHLVSFCHHSSSK